MFNLNLKPAINKILPYIVTIFLSWYYNAFMLKTLLFTEYWKASTFCDIEPGIDNFGYNFWSDTKLTIIRLGSRTNVKFRKQMWIEVKF